MNISAEYAAGFFDGEGCIGIYPGTYKGKLARYHLRTQLAQNKNPQTIALFEWFSGTFGGHSSTQVSLSGKDKLNWQLHGDKASNFLAVISQYSILKKPQIDIATAWQNKRPKQIHASNGDFRFETLPNLIFDAQVCTLMKRCKRAPLEDVLLDTTMLDTYTSVLSYIGCNYA
jgi:hypothetical protein